ncbi:MAG: VTT domain-containing protein [Acidobacteria bacterium]|nr:VTT domain-containing protein [Acidobacteriota bacterium]MDA1236160.1 VTT domain-containing protein [Acidobacteriota bacterium]
MKRFTPYIAAIALALIFAAVWRTGLLSQLSDHEALVAAMRSSGSSGYLICLAIQFAQVVVFMIPGEITQFAAGYVFGAWKGFLLSLVGIMLGSAVAYGFGKVAGRPALSKLLGEKTMERVDRAVLSPKAPTAMFLLFLLPGAPKDAMSYGAGVSGFPLGKFVLISGLGRIPALLASTLIGAQVYDRDYASVAITAAAAAAMAAAFWLYQRKSAKPRS